MSAALTHDIVVDVNKDLKNTKLKVFLYFHELKIHKKKNFGGKMTGNQFFDQKSVDIVMPDGTACGPDLEYDQRHLEFVKMALSRPEQQVGNKVIPAQEPDWRQVHRLGLALLQESRDLRIAITVIHAALPVHGIQGFTAGLGLIRSWLETYWEDVHPALTIDGEFDPLMRMNALASLADSTGILRALRQSRLLESPRGWLSVGEAEAILHNLPLEGEPLVSTTEQLNRLVTEEQARNRETLDAVLEAAETLEALESLWREKLSAEFWPELTPLHGLLETLTPLLQLASQKVAEDSPQAAASATATTNDTPALPSGAATPPPAKALPDNVSTRKEAFRALAIARTYFELHEPSHPAPILIKRIERLADLDFAAILAELAPEGLSQLKQLTGTAETTG